MATVLIVTAGETALVEAVAERLLGKIIGHMFRLYKRNMGVLNGTLNYRNVLDKRYFL